jgi:uncharacterized protein YlxW (UPF0749 family)
MVLDANSIIIAILASVLSGAGTALIAIFNDNKKEKNRRNEKAQDELKLELKDLQIKLYKLEKDLSEWKDKYYLTIQELISVRAELEDTLIKLSLIHLENEG